MPKILVIAEKPSVGRDYARVLHCRQKGEGCLIGEEYIVTWAVGHLIELCEPEAYDPKYKRWNRGDLPIIPETMKLQVIRQNRKQFQIVKKLMNDRQVESLICGTDSGREGELIFRYIYQIAGCHKPFRRLWVSSMTEEAITEGFRTLKDGAEYDRLYESARCRSEADWLVGMNGSRAFTLHYNALLSIGRVQTPTLAMIVARQQEIAKFIPQDYWEVVASLASGQGAVKARWFAYKEDGKTRNTHIESEAEAQEIASRCAAGTVAQVQTVIKTPKRQLPPLLYDLTELQREGNRRYGYSAAKVLNIAQALYEKHKLITYPRTDSRYLSEDMKTTVRETLHAMNIPLFHEALMGIGSLTFNARIIDNSKITDHHAIIPTIKRPVLESLNEEERRIYTMIAMRLITVFYPPYEYEMTEVIWKTHEDLLYSRGKTIIAPGYMALADNQPKAKKKKDEEAPLPEFHEGDTATIRSVKVVQSQTAPPQPYTEATLLSAMEYAGRLIEDEALKETMKKLSLGTPATRASIIERLIRVGYVIRKGKSLLPTEKGAALIAVVPRELKSPEMTGKWERALERIYQGTMDPEAFMQSIRRYVEFIVGAADEGPDAGQAFAQDPARRSGTKRIRGLGTCPLCGKGKVVSNTKSYYCSEWKQGCSWTVWFSALERYGDIMNDALIREILKNGTALREVTLPQTGEKGTAELYFTEKGMLEMKNFKRKA